MKLPGILTSEAFGVVIKYAITGVATVCGLDPVMSMALGEGSAALLKDGKEAQQDKAIALAEAAAGAAAKAFPVYQALPVKDQIGLMEGLAQVDDPQDLVNASFVQAELAKLPNSQVRKEAESYVRALPDHVRRTLASQGDPAGRTATAQSIPKNAQEFGAAFAAIPSIYKAGDAVPHMTGWVLEAQLGGGGFGEVWRARKREMLCAVKFCKGGASAANLRIERDLVERVTKLARRTPGLVQIEDDFLDQQPPSLVYEFVQGCTLETHLKARIREGKPFAWGEAAGMILELAETMAVCHRESIIHRDLKPANILLDLDDPAEPRLRITDFGIGAVLDGSTGMVMNGFTQSQGAGSAKYASPEQLRGAAQHPRDDIHALGIIWLQLLIGDLHEDQLDGPTRRGLLREGQPEVLIELLEECIATKPANRPENAVAMVGRLRSLLGASLGVVANPPAAPARQSTTATPPPLPVMDDYQLLAGTSAGERKLIEVAPGVTVPFRWCPPGRFTMGSPASEHAALKAAGKAEDFYSDEVEHTVTLTKGFWLAETEVTQGQWQAVMGTTLVQQANKMLADDTIYQSLGGKTLRAFKNAQKGEGSKHIGVESEEVAMYYVNWEEADEFCTKASRHAGQRGWAIALPTEAQWEYACRSGTSGMTYTGDFTIKGENNAPGLDAIAWYGGNSSVGYSGTGWNTDAWKEKQYPGGSAGPRRVGGRQSNEWGLYDMLGNVWEWCADCYGPYAVGSATDPQGATTGAYRVNRGGSWNYDAAFCRAAHRNWFEPGIRNFFLGFRPALVPSR